MSTGNSRNGCLGFIAFSIVMGTALSIYQWWTEPKPRLADDISEAYVLAKCPVLMRVEDDDGWKRCLHNAEIMDPFSHKNNHTADGEDKVDAAERAVTRLCGPKKDSDIWRDC